MKLANSVETFKGIYTWMCRDSGFMRKWMGHAHKTCFNYLERDKPRAAVEQRLLWDFWWQMPSYLQRFILSQSIPDSEWVGGYPDIKDSHIETLLRNVVIHSVSIPIDQCVEHVEHLKELRSSVTTKGSSPRYGKSITNHVGETLACSDGTGGGDG